MNYKIWTSQKILLNRIQTTTSVIRKCILHTLPRNKRKSEKETGWKRLSCLVSLNYISGGTRTVNLMVFVILMIDFLILLLFPLLHIYTDNNSINFYGKITLKSENFDFSPPLAETRQCIPVSRYTVVILLRKRLFQHF